MIVELWIRVGTLALIVLLAWGGFTGFRWIQTGRVRAHVPGFLPGQPAVLLFSAPDCQPCKVVQKPEILKLRQDPRCPVQFLEIDVSAQPQLARSWGVLSLPTTVILDKNGQTRFINPGVTRTATLAKQLAQLRGAQSKKGKPRKKLSF